MSWALLTPLYLLGGLAVAVPIIVHWRRQRRQPRPFPSLRFILGSEIRTQGWRKLMRWLVLACRMLVFLLLALAFAGPRLLQQFGAVEQATVLLVDESASMRAGTRWAEAVAAAAEVAGRRDPKHQVALVRFGRSAKLVTPLDGPEADGLPAALEALEPSYEKTDVDQALRLADDLLRGHPAPRLSVVAVSDMTAPWLDVRWETPLSPGIEFATPPLEPAAAANLAVVKVTVPRSHWGTEPELPVEAEIRNFSGRAWTGPVRCLLAEREAGEQAVTVPPQAARTVRFAVSAAGATEPLAGEMRIEPADGFAPDDRRHFVIDYARPVRVGRWPAGPAAAGQDRFLKTAVMPWPTGGDNRFAFSPIEPDAPGPLRDSADVIVIDHGTPLAAPASAALREFVAGGGGLVVILQGQTRQQDWDREWLGLTVEAPREPTPLREPRTPLRIDFTHPVLAPLSGPEGGNLFGIRVRGWQPFRLDRGRSLMALADDEPLLAVRDLAAGRVAVFALPLDRRWSDWPIQPNFLPLMHRLLDWMLERGGRPAELLVGDAAPDGKVVTEPGFWRDPATGLVRAVNLDPAESDLTPVTLPDLAARLTNPVAESAPGTATAASSPEDGRSFAWWLLGLVLLLEIGELALANRTPG
jgi:hypothetical protein